MADAHKSPMALEQFMKVEFTPGGKPILDPYSFYMTDFPYSVRNSIGKTLRIDRSQAGVPDLISWQNYSSHDYWWLLCLVNLIIRPDREIQPGLLFFLPTSADIGSFLQDAERQTRVIKIVQMGVSGAQTPR